MIIYFHIITKLKKDKKKKELKKILNPIIILNLKILIKSKKSEM